MADRTITLTEDQARDLLDDLGGPHDRGEEPAQIIARAVLGEVAE